jgi:hypothetical protein
VDEEVDRVKYFSRITFTTADCLRAASLRRPRLALLSVEMSRGMGAVAPRA